MVRQKGYSLLILLFTVVALTIGLLIAVPVWNTQVQREKETELIFRGNQYVEAIRLYQLKKPGQYPKKIEDLVKERCLRKLFKDPMTKEGLWNIILLPASPGQAKGKAVQKILIVPEFVLDSIQLPRIIGVVSRSTQHSIKIYNNQETYDKWLFFYGQDPENMPEIIYYGED
jgi:type II secretory pathway pseudopilin PulG